MKRDYKVPLAVQMAEDVLSMHYELERLRDEVAELREYRKKYSELLDSSINHSQAMVRGVLGIALTPGVMDAIAASNAQGEVK